MKKILVTQRLLTNKDYPEDREALDIRWGAFFRSLNFLPISLPTNFDFENYFQEISLSGILLTGGNDLNSFTSHYLNEKRDCLEKRLLEYARLHKIPVLGVCRGMQIMAEFFGATLESRSGHVKKKLEMKSLPESFLSPIVGETFYNNSYHNCSVTSIPSDFLLAAKSSDGVVKAMEHKELPFFAIMWHPERNAPFFPEDLKIFTQVFS